MALSDPIPPRPRTGIPSRPRTGLFRRLLRLWRLFAWMDLVWATRGWKQFLFYTLSDTVLSISSATAVLLLAERLQGIGAWSKFQVIFMLGYATLVRGFGDLFFNFNLLFISRRIGRGQLDHCLVQPQPLWMIFLTEGFLPFSGSAILVPATGLLTWSIPHLSLKITPWWLAIAALNLAASIVVMVAYSFLWGSLAFLAPRAAEEISSSWMRLMDQLKTFPLEGLGPALQMGMITILPVGLVAWAPCRFLVGLDPSPRGALLTPLLAVALSVISTGIFLKGLQHYGRTGSQRYLSFGHRR